jgi:magnesium transporter
MAATPTDATKQREGAQPRSDGKTPTKVLDVKTSYAGAAGGPSSISGLVCSDHGKKQVASVADVTEALADPTARVWIDAADASEAEIGEISKLLGLHPLVAEDIIERNQRAKVEFVGETLHMVMFALTYKDELQRDEIDIVLGERFLLTSHPRSWVPHESMHMRRLGVDHFLSQGTDMMLYAIVDPIVDGYFPVLDRLGEELDELEDEVVQKPDQTIVERLFRVRRELLEVRHTVTPEREVFNQLTNREVGLIATDKLIYFRDVYDHLIRMTDELDTFRELAAGAIETYLSTVNNNLSEIMKRLTAVTAILAGVGAVAGIFGMSEATSAFKFQEGSGFWLVTGFCIAVGVFVYVFFRRIHWI